MGSGSYWAVIYGCKDFRACCDSDDTADKIAEILGDLECNVSYEGSSEYAGIELLTTRPYANAAIPDGVISIDNLPTAIREAISAESLKKARDAWAKAQEAATVLGVKLPDGELLWLGDYD